MPPARARSAKRKSSPSSYRLHIPQVQQRDEKGLSWELVEIRGISGNFGATPKCLVPQPHIVPITLINPLPASLNM